MSRVTWTRESVVEAIQAFVAHHGRWPLASDCRGAQGLPTVHVILRLYGGLEAARLAAGMPAGALPKRGAAFELAWADTWPREEQEY